jgi:hypothetical protein
VGAVGIPDVRNPVAAIAALKLAIPGLKPRINNIDDLSRP